MRNKEVELRARQFCEDHGINEYPVKIIDICNKLGLGVFDELLDGGISGLIVIDDKVWDRYGTDKFILVNCGETPERKRFTIAHELAHFVLHRENNTLYAHRDTKAGGMFFDKKEHEANYFATNILMPETLVHECVCDAKIWGSVTSNILIRNVAQNFLVSEKAAEVRLKQLGII